MKTCGADGLLVVSVALDGGRILSIDSGRRPAPDARFGLPIPPRAIPALVVLASINAVAATITAFNMGITPDAYVDNMPSMVTAFVAVISGSLAFAGLLQQNPALDHSGQLIRIVARSQAKDRIEPV
jgi:hypothetical protein